MKEQSFKRMSYAVLSGPAIAVYAAVVVIPVLVSFGVGFLDWNGFRSPKWVGLTNYWQMLIDPAFRHDIQNNLLIVAISIFGQIPLGFVLAFVLYRRMVRFGGFFETMIFLPITISAVVVAILWNRIIVSPSGVLATALHNPPWLQALMESEDWAIVPVLFVILWMYTGLYMIIFLANMQKISQSTIDAALLDGASEWQILRKVVAPNLVGVIFTCSVFAIAGSLKSFDLIWAMTSGGPARHTEVLSIYMYDNLFYYALNPFGMGAASSVMMILISVGLIKLVQSGFRKLEHRYE